MYFFLTQKWWVPVLRGVLALFIGGVALIWPVSTLRVLFILLGVFLIIDGAVEGGAAWMHRRLERRWTASMFEGVLGFVIGVLALIRPLGIAFVLIYLLAFWALLTGAIRIAGGLQLRRMIEHEWLMILSGVLSILLGVFFILLPMIGLVALVWIFAAIMILFGMFQLFLGRRLRHARLGANYEISVTEYLSTH